MAHVASFATGKPTSHRQGALIMIVMVGAELHTAEGKRSQASQARLNPSPHEKTEHGTSCKSYLTALHWYMRVQQRGERQSDFREC